MTARARGELIMTKLRLVTIIAGAALAAGCTHHGAQGGPEAAHPPAAAEREPATSETKVAAPVALAVASSARNGRVDVVLNVRALSNARRGVARIVLPAGVTLVSGAREVELGALHAGTAQDLKVTLAVPAKGRFQIFSGVDVYISSGILLHREAEPLILGE